MSHIPLSFSKCRTAGFVPRIHLYINMQIWFCSSFINRLMNDLQWWPEWSWFIVMPSVCNSTDRQEDRMKVKWEAGEQGINSGQRTQGLAQVPLLFTSLSYFFISPLCLPHPGKWLWETTGSVYLFIYNLPFFLQKGNPRQLHLKKKKLCIFGLF